jgi:hypothetical protein
VALPSYWTTSDAAATAKLKPYDLQSKFGNAQRVVIDAGSAEYREIEQLIDSSWDAALVGFGNDAWGLSHSKIAVRRIWRIENARLYHKYRSKRNQLCLSAASNKPFPPIKGLDGEDEVVTRELGMLIA